MTAPHFHTHVDDARAVGRRLREARLAAGLSQRQLAFPGCSAAYISRLEAGDRVPSLQLLRKLAAKLRVDEGYLATGSPAEPTRPAALGEAEIMLRFGDLDAAAGLFEQALGTTGSVRARALALGGLGRVALGRGDARAAIDALEDALDLDPRVQLEQPALVEALGRAYAAADEPDSPLGVYERALAHATEADDLVARVRFAALLAEAGGRTEDTPAELDGLGEDPETRARLYWSRSRVHAAGGDHDAAARYARRALALLELADEARHLSPSGADRPQPAA